MPSNNKILVTGSDGFIGSHLTEFLVRNGYTVRAFVYYNSSSSWGWLDTIDPKIQKEIEVVTGDIRDTGRVYDAVKECKTIFHLASLISIPYSYIAPQSYVDTNILGTLNILEAAKSLEVERVIHTSTSEVYGTAQFVPITEEHPLQAQSPYSASKIGADQLAMSFYHSFKLPVSIIRPFNTYGPRQSARAVIPAMISQVLSGAEKIRLGNTNPTRDFNYIEDTVKGFYQMSKAPNILGEVINLGSNFEISISDVVDIVAEVAGVTLDVEKDKERYRPENSEVDRLWADNSKALKLLDWKPEYSSRDGFKEGIVKTLAWFRNPKNLKNYKPDTYLV